MLVGAALHDASANYYQLSGIPGVTGGTTGAGHPDTKLGWAVTGGFIFNLPMIAPGDRFSAQAVYTEGAVGYLAVTPRTAQMLDFDGANIAFGNWSDAVYGGGLGLGGINSPTSVQLTTGWSASAAFEHFWTPALRTSVYGSYIQITHNTTANNLLCVGATGLLDPAGAGIRCNNDWSAWNIGTRTQWEPVRGLIMGVDVIYMKLQTATIKNAAGNFGLVGNILGNSAGTRTNNELGQLDRHVPHPARLRSLIVRA